MYTITITYAYTHIHKPVSRTWPTYYPSQSKRKRKMIKLTIMVNIMYHNCVELKYINSKKASDIKKNHYTFMTSCNR